MRGVQGREKGEGRGRSRRGGLIVGVLLLAGAGALGFAWKLRKGLEAFWCLHSSAEEQLADARERFIGTCLGEAQAGDLHVVIGTLRDSARDDLLVVLHTRPAEGTAMFQPHVLPEPYDHAMDGCLETTQFILLKRQLAVTSPGSSLEDLARSLSPPGVGPKIKARIFELAGPLPADFDLALVDTRDFIEESKRLHESMEANRDWMRSPERERRDVDDLDASYWLKPTVLRRVARVVITVPPGAPRAPPVLPPLSLETVVREAITALEASGARNDLDHVEKLEELRALERQILAAGGDGNTLEAIEARDAPAATRVRISGDPEGTRDATPSEALVESDRQPAGPDLEAEIAALLAREARGHSLRGARLFSDPRVRCATCHSVEGDRRGVGPPLDTIGEKLDREGLVRAVLDPSEALVPGYRATTAVLGTSTPVSGLLQRRTPEGIVLLDVEGKERSFRAREVVRLVGSDISLMPEGLHRALTADELDDLFAYLETLRLPPTDTDANPGQPAEIPALATPIGVVPWIDESLRFDQPVFLVPFPGSATRFVVLEHRRARVWLLEKHADGDRKSLFVDLAGQVSDGPWEGLMSIAFHPDFARNRRYFIKHELIESDQRKTVVVERRARDDLLGDSGKVAFRLIEIPQPADNHNGGTAIFGPDGYLYVAMGDGGPQEDPDGHSQNPRDLLGAMLRLDVDSRVPGLAYGIPPTNPWPDGQCARAEVWAIGFREPWRFTFDRLTGDLWLGDVGQNRFEEVTIVRAGENHGWNAIEGFTPFSQTYRRDDASYTPPVLALERKHSVSVTGGYVYRGDESSSFFGAYIFGDFETRRIWALRAKGRRLETIREIGRAPEKIAAFGEGADGALYLVGYAGMLYRLDLEGTRFE